MAFLNETGLARFFAGLKTKFATKDDIPAPYIHPVNHPASMITGLPTSLPASDVSAWAKASSKPKYTASEVGAVPTSNVGNEVNKIPVYNADGHLVLPDGAEIWVG